MPAPRLDDEIARLYQLPLSEFTAARNLLARNAGARAAEIKSLVKPPVPAWAVNQLFWQDRATSDRLLEAAADVRAAHGAVLAGKRSDVRASGRAHEEAIEAALKSALAILREAGHPATDATRQAIATTLRALPGDELPGRLSRTLQPAGFEVLAGLPVKSAPGRVAPASRGKTAPQGKESKGRDAAAETREQERDRERDRAKEARAEAEREVRLAEHTAKREEFEAARAAREAEKAARAVTEARTAVEEAEAALAEAEAAERTAREAKEAADGRARDANEALQTARDKLRTVTRGR
jgi:hypothetical protein